MPAVAATSDLVKGKKNTTSFENRAATSREDAICSDKAELNQQGDMWDPLDQHRCVSELLQHPDFT